jgi:hypothetical protein
MAGITNRGKYLMLCSYITGDAPPATFYMALVTDAAAPSADTNTMSELTEIPAGNGYTSGGLAVARNTTDWDTRTENDPGDLALVQTKDLAWTASGGNMPPSGTGARYAVLTTDEAAVADRQVVAWFNLGSNRIMTDGYDFTLQNCELRLTE